MRELKFAGAVAALAAAHQLGLPTETAVILAVAALIYFALRHPRRSRAQDPPGISDPRQATLLSQAHAQDLGSARDRQIIGQMAPGSALYLASHLSHASSIAQGMPHRRAGDLARKSAHLARQATAVHRALSNPRTRHSARTAAMVRSLARQTSRLNSATKRSGRSLSRNPAGRDFSVYLGSASALAGTLDTSYARAHTDHHAAARHDRARRRAEAQTRHAQRAARQRAGQVTSLARKLAALAAALLPAAYRDRYIEEFRSDLWELARSGASRRRQLREAWGMLRTVLSLRRALLAGRKRNPPS
jgi:hypothetical protein